MQHDMQATSTLMLTMLYLRLTAILAFQEAEQPQTHKEFYEFVEVEDYNLLHVGMRWLSLTWIDCMKNMQWWKLPFCFPEMEGLHSEQQYLKLFSKAHVPL